MAISRWLAALLALTCWMALPPTIEAQNDPLWERGGLSLGSFFDSSDSNLRADATSDDFQIGTEINFEDTLGLDSSSTLLKARLSFLFGRRHELSLGAYEFNRSASQVLSQDIEFEDTEFPATADVETELNNRNIELAYTYYVVRRDRFGLGLSGGIVGFEIDASLRASIQLGPLVLVREEEASAEVPIPMIGARVRGLLHPRIVVLAEARFLPRVEVDDVDGSSQTLSVGLEGRILPHLRLGVAYESFELDANIVDSSFTGSVDWSESGTQLYLRLVW